MYVVQEEYTPGNSVAKRLPDGSADVSFGVKGTIKGDGYTISTAAVQSDGKIVTAGVTAVNDTSNFAIARYNTNGSLDSSFAGDGKQATHISSVNTGDYNSTNEAANLIAIQKDGKIIIAGLSSHVLSLVRYNTDGSLDRTFNGDGLLQGSDYHLDDHHRDIPPTVLMIQNDGKIVVGGGGEYQPIVRYNSDGSPDNSFSIRKTLQIYSVAAQSNGKIVAAVDSAYYDVDGDAVHSAPEITRLNIDGSFDSSFSDNGILANTGGSLAVQDDRKIIVIHTGFDTAAGKYNFNIDRYNSDGSLDNTFSNDGKQMTNFDSGLPGYGPIAMTVAIQSDGKIVVGGGVREGYDNNYNKYPGYFALARYNKDGSLDNTFDKDGKVTDSTSYAGKTVYNQIEIQKDKKIVAAGNTWNGREFVSAAVRYNTDGSLDSIFSNNINIIPGSNTAIQKDGKTVTVDNNVVSRYNSDGSLDKTFGVDGHQKLNFTIPGHYYLVNFTSLAIQSDEKIVLGGDEGDIAIVRLNTNGSVDSTYGKDGFVILENHYDKETEYFYSCSIIIQNDDKVVVGADLENVGVFLARLNVDGSIDSTFNETPVREFIQYDVKSSLALQSDGKIVVGGAVLLRYNTDGSVDSTFNINAYQNIDFAIRDIAISDNKLYVAGGDYFGTVARYLLDNNNTPPTVTLTTPANNTIRLAPAAHIKLSAAAADEDGTITKVEFYNGTKLLHTETVIPYGYVWKHVQLGNYTLTAKAYDNSGNVTTSAPVHISVVPNKPPVVSITKPVNNRSFAAPGYIHLEAAASDTDGRVTNVKFYNGSSLLRTEYEYPYTYHWENVPVGTYTITAVATDNWGAHTTSAPVTIVVTSANAMIVSKKPSENNKTPLTDDLRISLYPNPATNIVNIFTKGLQQNKTATISIISVSGIVLKTMQTISSTQTQLNISTLAKGVYTIKIISGDKILYKQFVKL